MNIYLSLRDPGKVNPGVPRCDEDLITLDILLCRTMTNNELKMFHIIYTIIR